MQKYISHLLTLSFIIQYTTPSSKYDKLEPRVLQSFNGSIPFNISNTIQSLSNCIPSTIKINTIGETFISFPKYKPSSSCPTFTKFIYSSTTNTSYFLPFPNNETLLSSVTGFEIDKDNNFFLLDQGTHSLTILSPIGNLLQQIDLSPYINISNSFLSDIVLDTVNGYAFISNCISFSLSSSPNTAPQLIIVNYTLDHSNLHSPHTSIETYTHESFNPDKSYWLHINDMPINEGEPLHIGLSSLSISCSFDYLYYAPLSSNKIYSVKIEDIFVSGEVNVDIWKYKGFSSSSMLMSGKANLYLTDLDNSLIRKYKLLTQMKDMNYKNMLPLHPTHAHRYKWPTSMAFKKNELYYISNNYHLFMNDEKVFAEILVINIENEKSYVQGCSYDDFSWSYKNIILWSVFSVLILIVLSFVLVSSNKQDESVTKIDNEELVD